MKKLIFIFASLFIAFAQANAQNVIHAPTETYDVRDSGKSYTMIVMDKNRNPIFKWRVDYIGKSPTGEYNNVHDWETKDTDFFDLFSWTYHDAPIYLIERKTWFDRKTNRYQSDDNKKESVPEYIVTDLKRTKIKPEKNKKYQGKCYRNHFIWHDGPYAIFHRVTKFTYKGVIYQYDRPLVYSRSGQSTGRNDRNTPQALRVSGRFSRIQ